jgi:hypothetical protein
MRAAGALRAWRSKFKVLNSFGSLQNFRIAGSW